MSLAAWQSFARSTGLRGWSRLKKDDLVNFLLENLWMGRGLENNPKMNKAARLRIWKHHKIKPLDEKNPKIDAPILLPEKRPFPSKRIPRAIEENVNTVVDWTNWLESVDDVDVRRRSNPAVEKLKKQIAELWKEDFVVEERESALRGFAKIFNISGRPGFSPREFLKKVSWKVINLLESNKRTKTKMILSCRMSRMELRTGYVIEQMADFHSRMEMNLEGTDRKELFYHMVERILENLANFQRGGSNWRFEEVIDLMILFTKHQPLGGEVLTFHFLPV